MKKDSKKDSKVVEFLKGSVILVGANMVLKAINFFLLPLYTKYLSPADMGVSDSITTLTAFLFPLLVMGLDSAFSAFFYDERTEEHGAKVFNTITFSLIPASIVPMIVAIFASDISKILFGTREYGLLVGVGLFAVSFNMWWLPFSLLVRMQNRMTLFAIINVIASLTMIGLNIVFVSVLQWGAASLIVSGGIVQLLQLALYLLWAKAPINPRACSKELRGRVMKFALPLVPTVLAGWALNLSNRYIILGFCGESQVGVFGIADRFAGVVAVISSAVYMSYTAFAFNKKDDENANKQYARILSAFFLMLLAACFTIALFGKEVVELMTNEGYYLAYLMLPGILFGQIAYGIDTLVGYGIAFSKKTIYSLIAILIGAGTNVVLSFIFIPKYGAVAAAYTSLVGYVVMTFVVYKFSQKLYPCDYRIVRILVLGVLAFAVLLIALEMSFLIKLGVWLGMATISGIVFRDVLVDFAILFMAIINKFRRKHEEA